VLWSLCIDSGKYLSYNLLCSNRKQMHSYIVFLSLWLPCRFSLLPVV
jgi:hypothetical protein